jgi:hypothetical protein
MNIEVVRRVLLWCTVINYGILLVWFLFLCWHTIGCISFTDDGFVFQWTSLTCFTTRGCRFSK